MLGLVAVGVLSVLFLLWAAPRSNPRPTCGIYSQPGRWYWLKRISICLLMYVRKYKGKWSSSDSGYGVQSRKSQDDMDKPQPLCDHPQALDSAYFSGFDHSGSFLVFRIGRRHGRFSEVWLYIQIPGLGNFQHVIHPDSLVGNTDGTGFRAGGLAFEMTDPHRTWRVTYNGILRQGFSNELNSAGEGVHVKLSFIWKAFTDVFDLEMDCLPWTIADAIARETWTKEFWKNLRSSHQTHYEQWGEMQGYIDVEGKERKMMTLKSFRDHTYGIRDWRDIHRHAIHMIHMKSGMVLHLGMFSMPGVLSHLMIGYLIYPDGNSAPISYIDLNLAEVGEDYRIGPPNQYSFTFIADGVSHDVTVRNQRKPMFYQHDDRGSMVYEMPATFIVDGKEGVGITEFHYRNPAGPPKSHIPKSYQLIEEPPGEDIMNYRASLVLPFHHKACGSSALVGGKGSQLALLTLLQDKEKFTVPSGFCLTLEAFQQQLKAFPGIVSEINALGNISRGGDPSVSLQRSCEASVEIITNARISSNIHQAIVDQMTEMFGGDLADKTFAVRSSAADEDGSEASSAGQMETFLGMRGMEQILQAVTKCWASAYTFVAVQYRRQHGQPIKTAVGVVIQEMVQSEASGVLFTCDPISGNPSVLLLNANYGLGESVVSGKVEPDTIKLTRNWNDEVHIQEKQLGSKKMQYSVSGDGGIIEGTPTRSDAAACCLSDDTILELATLGVKLENYFGSARDVEWAVFKDKIYLLQARPVTSLEQESEEELLHEFDTALCGYQECLTIGNIGEMMPGAIVPLSQHMFHDVMECALKVLEYESGTSNTIELRSQKGMTCFTGTLLLNLHFVIQAALKVAGCSKDMAELALLGETLSDTTMEEYYEYGGTRPSFVKRILNLLYLERSQRKAYKLMMAWSKRLEAGYKINHHDSAMELYHEIHNKYKDYVEISVCTVINSGRSGSMSNILMAILTKGKTEWTSEHYGDLAMLLSDCTDVISAQVPFELQEITRKIADLHLENDFQKLTDKDAVTWLNSPDKCGAVSHLFKTFLLRHGHRCVREAEIYEKPWRVEPEKLIKVMQSILRTESYKHKPKTVISLADTIKQLKSPTTFIGRFLLNRIVPSVRSRVSDRELGKSVWIKMIDIFREAYWRLAAMMVQEDRLPNASLVFFLTHLEIKQLLETRSAKLINKAMKRKKVLPKQMKMKYPKYSIGHPQQINLKNEEKVFQESSCLTGMPICQGEVTGVVRVITSLEEADLIQEGEILIAPYTDIGWTPYFPLIAGLVTEIGGLLSHGAVVAREYGLPCIVNARMATQVFKSGDRVLLNGTKGTVTKIEE